jgi:hypothetical protein
MAGRAPGPTHPSSRSARRTVPSDEEFEGFSPEVSSSFEAEIDVATRPHGSKEGAGHGTSSEEEGDTRLPANSAETFAS